MCSGTVWNRSTIFDLRSIIAGRGRRRSRIRNPVCVQETRMTRWIEPVTLEGSHVRLEPLTLEHVPALEQAAADGELWRLWYTSVPPQDGMQAYVEKALAWRDAGGAMPWAVRAADGDIVGSTRYGNVDADN